MTTYTDEVNIYNPDAIEGSIADKADRDDIPTSLSQLVNDTGFVLPGYHEDIRIPAVNISGLLTSNQIATDELWAAFMAVASLSIGNAAGAHIESSGNRMSFMNGNQEVAYIDIDTQTNEGVFYMSRSIVVKDMQFGGGKWKWYKRSNNNMSVKWMGGM